MMFFEQTEKMDIFIHGSSVSKLHLNLFVPFADGFLSGLNINEAVKR